jgi:probable HAF family extracellular repeat protein
LGYSVLDLGDIPSGTETRPAQIDEAGRIAGYHYQGVGSGDNGFIYDQYLYNGRITFLERGSSRVNGLATAMDGSTWETGYYVSNGQTNSFRQTGTNFVTFAAPYPATAPVGVAINGNGTMAGFYVQSGQRKPFRLLRTMSTLSASALLSDIVNGVPVAINKNDLIVGNHWNTGAAMPFIHNGASKTDLVVPYGYVGAYANGLSDEGKVAGYLEYSYSRKRSAAVWVQGSGWGALPAASGQNWVNYEAAAVNTFGQVVGSAALANGQTVAFIYSGQSMYDLNSLLPENSGWVLEKAVSINRNKQIAGIGRRKFGNGIEERRAFLAVPSSTIGKRIMRPEGTVARLPIIEMIEGSPGDSSLNSFYWSEVEKSLYAIRPVKARLKWLITLNMQDTNNITIPTLAVNTWPKDPQIHVAGAPITVMPPPGYRRYEYANMEYSTIGSAKVDSTTKIFNVPTNTTGYTVLRYLRTYGMPADPNTQSNAFTVARSVYVYDTNYLKDLSWPIGTALTDAMHTDYRPLNGYVFFLKTAIDASGQDAAYDQENRLGAILAVNKINRNAPVYDMDLITVWYTMNELGVAWGWRPVRYTTYWPTNTAKIIIASAQGSNLGGNDPVTDQTYLKARIYNQPDPALSGFNPNEEHAMLLPANLAAPDPLVFDELPPQSAGLQGNSAFALRNDLNKFKNFSEPFVLLKFIDPRAGEWRVKLFRVVMEEYPYFFRYPGVAGTEIQPPYPLSILPVMKESSVVRGLEYSIEDYRGKIYATAAGLDGGLNTNLLIRYFYALQPGFFYDRDPAFGNDAPVNTPIAWLDDRTGGVHGIPIDVNYVIKWPEDRAVLSVGETLMRAKHGLPGVADMARVQMVFDSINPQLTNGWQIGPGYMSLPPTNAARIYDPLSDRYVKCGSSFNMPDVIRLEDGPLGRKYFTDLPYQLRCRLSYDPINKWMYFKGVLDESNIGEPLLLPNVMSLNEKNRVQEIDKIPGSTFDQIIAELYQVTRNPNQLDLDRNGAPDNALLVGLQYAVQSVTYQNGLPVITYKTDRIELESFPSGYKALTAAQGDNVPAIPQPGNALSLNGSNQCLLVTNMPAASNLLAFTWEARVKRASANTEDTILYQGINSRPLRAGFTTDGYFFFEFEGQRIVSPKRYQDVGTWHHWAGTYDRNNKMARVYRDGVLVVEVGDLAMAVTLSGPQLIGATPLYNNTSFHGDLDEVRIWHGVARDQSQIQAYSKWRLTSAQTGLVGYWLMDEAGGSQVADASGYRHAGQRINNPGITAVQNGDWGLPPRFVALVENNDQLLGALPVTVKVIEIGPGPYAGDLKVLYPDNVFDERLTLRVSSDFGGEPERFEFEWYYKPDAPSFKKSDLPVLDQNGNVSELRGWIAYTRGFGSGNNYVTLGEGGESGLLTISDNWFICRYRGYKVANAQPWSVWIGDPSSRSVPQPMLAEGWIKRVVRGVNPFDERVNDFVNNQASTKVSIVQQAGQRYEGDIAFNPAGENIQRIGLIEAYETVLRRGKSLSTDGTPPVNYQPANDALLFMSSRLCDLYLLLGNEAMADAADPTIGFTTSSGYGNTASSIFAFQNQLDSLLEEELTLLRGRDDRSAGVQGIPIYNRLFWNFTLGDGEVAYQQLYNISDQNSDGKVDEKDARILYPQGHGDAWGHYLTATTSYYDLLRNQNFTWVPRSENVLLAGVPVKVDYLDERKFAKAAAAKAKAGAEIVDLTYRLNFVDDPNGQWQGYKDTDTDRAWGVDDWASRAAVGAYFDWVMGNAILPAYDADATHTGIDKIDRTTVGELNEINAQLSSIQQQIDKSDQGLNPIGLAKGVVPFDLDPAAVDAGQTHFEQIYDRAMSSMANAMTVFNEVNTMNQALRGNQDSAEVFAQQVQEQECDYKNRLIEVFGYPYAGDIGPGKTYPSGYDGPDLLHYMYIPTTDINGDNSPPSSSFTAFFKPMVAGFGEFGLTFPEDTTTGTNWITLDSESGRSGLQVDYPVSANKYAFKPPATWGLRRAPGELQNALSDLVQAEAKLKQCLRQYDNLIGNIKDTFQDLEGEVNVTKDQIEIKKNSKKTQLRLSAAILAMTEVQIVMNRASEIAAAASEAVVESLPKVVGLATDATAPIRGMARVGGFLAENATDLIADAAEGISAGLEYAKEDTELQTDIDLDSIALKGEEQAKLKAALALVREEAPLRLELYTQREVVAQTAGKYLSMIAQGQRILDERIAFRKKTAGEATKLRYSDMAFRIFRNDAIQKYRAQFDLAARYTYLSATAYDYESNLIGNDGKAGRRFLTDIVRQRTLGQLSDGNPIVGRFGLADQLARMSQNFKVMKSQMGFNNPQTEENAFSLRSEWFRIKPVAGSQPDETADELWRATLMKSRVADLWSVPEFRRYCRPMAPESAGAQPAIIIRFPTTVTFGLNYFGWPLGGRDSAYDPTLFATKVRSAGVWFDGYNGNGMANTPRVYFIPTGADILRSPNGDNFETRMWRVVDQKLPIPYPIGQADFRNAAYIPMIDNLGGEMAAIRKYSSFRAYHDAGFDMGQMTRDSRLIGRSVWNTEWMLIIPGGTLLNDPNAGLDAFVNSVSDIKFSFQTYSYSGN